MKKNENVQDFSYLLYYQHPLIQFDNARKYVTFRLAHCFLNDKDEPEISKTCWKNDTRNIPLLLRIFIELKGIVQLLQ